MGVAVTHRVTVRRSPPLSVSTLAWNVITAIAARACISLRNGSSRRRLDHRLCIHSHVTMITAHYDIGVCTCGGRTAACPHMIEYQSHGATCHPDPPPPVTYPGRMRRPGPSTHAVISVALWTLIIILSPVILLAGELVNRYVMRRARPSASTARVAVVWHSGRPAHAAAVRLPMHTSFLLTVISNPLWIALTAPGRWVNDRFSRHGHEPPNR
jgi:hypothetical protein